MSRFGPVPLTPTAFLDRARAVHGDQTALVDGDVRRTYAELADRCERLAGALAGLGVAPGDRVSVLAPNTGVALEAHFGVPWAGAVLNALNTRLSAAELAYDRRARRLAACCSSTPTWPTSAGRSPSRPDGDVRVVVGGGPDDEYEALLAGAEPLHVDGRGRAVAAVAQLHERHDRHAQGRHVLPPRRLPAGPGHGGADRARRALGATCGRCRCSTATAGASRGRSPPPAATHVALRKVEPQRIWQALRDEGVTHLCAAPTVLTGLASAPEADEGPVGAARARGDRRRAAVARAARADGRARPRRHPPVRADRDLRPGGDLRVEAASGTTSTAPSRPGSRRGRASRTSSACRCA